MVVSPSQMVTAAGSVVDLMGCSKFTINETTLSHQPFFLNLTKNVEFAEMFCA